MKLLSVAALVMAFSLTASAEPVLGPDVILGTYGKFDGFALARVSTESIAYVRSENGTIRLQQLDRDLRANPDIPELVLPLLQQGGIAVDPAIASNGRNLLIAWKERVAGLTVTVYAAIATDFRTILAGPAFVGYGAKVLKVFATGSSYSIVTDLLYRLDERLTISSQEALPSGSACAVNRTGEVAVAQLKAIVICEKSRCTQSNTLLLTAGSFSKTISDILYGGSSPAVTPRQQDIWLNGALFVATWSDFQAQGYGVTSFSTTEEVKGWTIHPSSDSVSAEGNGADVVVAWFGWDAFAKYLVHITVLHPDGTQTSPWIAIAPGLYPQVVRLTNSDFIVAREQSYNPYVIAAQHVTITSSIPDEAQPATPPPPARRRAVGH